MILYVIYKDSKKPQDDLCIKEGNIKQLQELAVGIKLSNIEKIESVDVTTFEHNNCTQVIEVIVDETVNQDNNRSENDVITGEVTEKLPRKGNKKTSVSNGDNVVKVNGNEVATGELPRGDFNVWIEGHCIVASDDGKTKMGVRWDVQFEQKRLKRGDPRRR